VQWKAERKFSRGWKIFPRFFQGLEGFAGIFSEAWKIFTDFFQALENGRRSHVMQKTQGWQG